MFLKEKSVIKLAKRDKRACVINADWTAKGEVFFCRYVVDNGVWRVEQYYDGEYYAEKVPFVGY